MKTKSIFILLMTLAIIASCSPALQATQIPAFPTLSQIKTPTLLLTQQTVIEYIPYKITTTVLSPTMRPITLNPIIGPSSTPLPTSIPYPTASVVQANAVAFIEKESENNLSLWIANVDGSGERKIVENIGKWSDTTNYFLRWSPNGKWISYISNGGMWIVSPDGSERREVLSASDKSKRLISYNWAPDDSQIAYTQVSLHDSKFDSESVRILNLITGETYEVSTEKPQFYGIIVRWSPDGQFLAFNKNSSFVVFDVVNRIIEKEILPDNSNMCSALDNTGPVWSPNSKWFFHFHGTPTGVSNFWICISGLDGSNHRIDVDGITFDAVWDQTGNYLYFVAKKIDAGSDPNLDSDQRLQRYDVRTQKLERLLSLGPKYRSVWSVSISPDGRTLETHTEISENQTSYIFMDLKSLSTREFTIDSGCVWWLGDSQNFICLSQSNSYSVFHKLNIQTGERTIFSGKHAMVSWVISPIATTP